MNDLDERSEHENVNLSWLAIFCHIDRICNAQFNVKMKETKDNCVGTEMIC